MSGPGHVDIGKRILALVAAGYLFVGRQLETQFQAQVVKLE